MLEGELTHERFDEEGQRRDYRGPMRPQGEAGRCEGPRDYRVRHFGRRVGGNRHLGDYGVSAEAPGAVGRHCQRDQLLVAGQSTVEFAIVTAAFLFLVLALGAMWRLFSDGVVVQHAVQAAAYHVAGGASGVLADVFAV